MLFAQRLTLDRAQALWELGLRLQRGLQAPEDDPNVAAHAHGHVLVAAGQGTPAVAVDDEGRVFAVNLCEGAYVVRIGRVCDGMFRPSEWSQ